MLVSPKWQTMWMESQHCSKTTWNVLAPSQQAKKLLEDLRASCSSPNKAVQLEALKCWGAWINNQNQDDWKLNTVCYTAVRPLLPKKLQPLQKDVDVCMLRFSLMWALLKKVENIMQLEGPQYILEVFLQSCLNWLSSCAGEEGKDVMELIFQLLLGIFSKDETIHRKEMFQPLSTDILKVSKVFNRLADKFLNVFVHWKKVQDRKVILKLWKHFLELCELSYEHIAIPVWHKVFKLVGEMCSEKSEPVKDRLALLHACATTLRSVLSSSKFLDYGNLLTPCEGLMKKLVELCCWECEEFYDGEMFVQGMEVSKVLSVKSVAISGFGLCIDVLNLLDEFSLRSLYWGVWCGLVDCYECLLSKTEANHLTKVEMNFYRKLRGIAINFELDKNYLGEECVFEVERYIRVLKICPCTCRSSETKEKMPESEAMEVCDEKDLQVAPASDNQLGQLVPKTFPADTLGCFSRWKKPKPKPRVISFNSDLIKNILKTVDFPCCKWFLDGSFRFISFRICEQNSNISLAFKSNNKKCVVVRTLRRNVAENNEKKAITFPEKSEPEEVSTPKTRSRKRAEEEEKKKEMENQKRKTRKSFEIRVQEIVQKNKERKTEKNCRKSPTISLREKRKKKQDGEKKETPDRKGKKQNKTQKMENYFKVITKKREKEETPKGKGKKKKEEEKKDEIVWKQTSLISMMKGRETEGVRTRSKEKEVAGVKTKTKTIEGSPLTKMSPFKEVFHDHEYAKIEPQDLKALERVIVNKEETEKKTAGEKNNKQVPEKEKEKKRKTKTAREGTRKSKRLSETPTPEPDIEKETTKTTETIKNDENVPDEKDKVCESPKVEESVKVEEKVESSPEMKVEEKEEVSPKEEIAEVEDVPEILADEVPVSETPPKEVEVSPEEAKDVPEVVADEVPPSESPPKDVESTGMEVQSPVNLEEVEETSELDSTPRRGKKRFRILDSLKPSKKLRLEEPAEKLALEIEKENLKETSPTKEEKTSKPSPKMISSRALRMIALVPESTRGQMHWETSPRVEIKKKAPNVDKNSRASKMLALLSENIVREIVETEEIAVEEIKSNELTTTPVRKTPTSSLKSPKTVKQRRSIRFDDTKNEMVVYETDTPPSQVLEGKERCRRIHPPALDSPNSSFV